MTDLRKLLHRAKRQGASQVRFVADRPPASDLGDGRFVAGHDRPISDDALAGFLLDHVTGFDVVDIFSVEPKIGEILLDGEPVRVIKQRLDGILAVQVQLAEQRSTGDARRARTTGSQRRLSASRGQLVQAAWSAPERPTAHVPAVASPPGVPLNAAEAREAVAPGSGPEAAAMDRAALASRHAFDRENAPASTETAATPDAATPDGAAPNAATPREDAVVLASVVPEAPSAGTAHTVPTASSPRSKPMDTERANAILDAMVRAGASDVHVSAGASPWLRVDGVLEPIAGAPTLTSPAIEAMLEAIAPDWVWAQFQARNDADFAYERGASRFRVNAFRDRRGVGFVARCIPAAVPNYDDLGLPEHLRALCELRAGLVLVTGPTGSGKSTTLAALIDLINRQRPVHVVTVEDPIEYVHQNQRALINQREVGSHTESFPSALRAALREDPDVVLIGELRDLETTRIALKTAETGHLVFGTLHTGSATTTVDRIVNQFPGDERDQVRLSLSESLRAIVSQALCKKKQGGRTMAMEVLLGNRALANLIREARTFQIPSLIQTARGEGMQLLNDGLFALVQSGQVDATEALRHATDRAGLLEQLRRAGHTELGAPRNPLQRSA